MLAAIGVRRSAVVDSLAAVCLQDVLALPGGAAPALDASPSPCLTQAPIVVVVASLLMLSLVLLLFQSHGPLGSLEGLGRPLGLAKASVVWLASATHGAHIHDLHKFVRCTSLT
jgi:hypothetical protein